MYQTLDRKLNRLDDALQKLTEKRRHSSDPAVIIDVSDTIDRQLDERLTLMRQRDAARGGDAPRTALA